MFVCITTHFWVDLGVTDSKGSLLVQQDATVCRALIQNLFLIRTRWGCVGGLRTAMEIQARKWRLFVDECIFINVQYVFKHVHDGIGAVHVTDDSLGVSHPAVSELIGVIGHGTIWLSHVINGIVIVVSTQTTQCVLVTTGHQVETKERVERNE